MILFTEEEQKTRIFLVELSLSFDVCFFCFEFYFKNKKTPCCREKITALLDLK